MMSATTGTLSATATTTGTHHADIEKLRWPLWCKTLFKNRPILRRELNMMAYTQERGTFWIYEEAESDFAHFIPTNSLKT